jgi:uncharacterized LabA/DUF88 family protein
MELQDLKKEYVRDELSIDDNFGRIFCFVDFANVNNWFAEDTQDWDNKLLAEDEKLEINLRGLKEFSDILGVRTRIYYGEDPHSEGSKGFTYILRKVFGKRNVVTKDLQRIKHYLGDEEKQSMLKFRETDKDGKEFVEIRKCNFDVEVAVDAYKMIEHYDTFCLFSGDADFVYLNNFLRKKGKKVIIVKGGYILTKLRKSADLVINAQKIKKHITRKINIKAKQRPD